MSKLTLTKNTNAIFLAIILIAGTITSFSPTFMVGTAQAEPYYEMDKDRKQVSVSSLKCNNINVNVNGLELSVLPPFLSSGLEAEAQDANTNANSFANNGGSNSGSQINDFRFICINNNNNTVIETETPIPPIDECPEADEIESCFRQFLLDLLFPNFVDALELGITVEINGQEVTLRSFDDICEALDGLSTFDDLLDAIATILSTAGISVGSDVVTDIAECIAETLGIPIPSG